MDTQTLISTQDGRVLINEAAYNIISEAAPQELPLYVEYRNRYLSGPDEFVRPPESQDEALGFGAGVPVDTFSQVVFPILTPLLSVLVTEAAKSLGEGAGKQAVNWVRGLFDNAEAEQPAIFTAAHLAKIYQEFDTITKEETDRLGVDVHEAKAIRDALVARLAVTSA